MSVSRCRRLLGQNVVGRGTGQYGGHHISIGAHGCTHQLLTSLPPAERIEEIQKSRVEAEALSGLPVTGFTYPHGDRDVETTDMVRHAGYSWACSTHETIVDSLWPSLHDLPRIAVGDWRADILLFRMGTVSA
jgi:peptidoglycan/xylan/chitin deacetylase (PgdA/CDA1 family)